MRWLRRVWSWRLWFARPEPGSGVQPLVSHIHQWGPCRYNGQYWYARCIAYEWCTARAAC